MIKYKIIDTNYLLNDEEILFNLAPKSDDIHTKVIIPMGVLQELDKFKDQRDINDPYSFSDLALKARRVSRRIDSIVGNLSEGIKYGDNYTIQSSYKIEKEMGIPLPHILDQKTDPRLVEICEYLKERKNEDVELITADINLRNIARSVGVEASPWRDFEEQNTSLPIYTGWRKCEIDDDLKNKFIQEGFLPPSLLNLEEELMPNEYLVGTGGFVARYDSEKGGIVKLFTGDRKSKTKSKNVQQLFVMDALRNPKIKVVIIVGMAGTGKTYLAVDAGIEQTFSNSDPIYEKILITKPIVPHKGEQQLGYLPGDFEEKAERWMRPITDAFDELMKIHGIDKYDKDKYFKEKTIEIQTLETIRGMSYKNMYWIIDEGQNYRKDAYKTLCTRVAEGTKLVILGDLDQTDQINEQSISYVNNIYKEDEIAATIFFEKKINLSVRSQVCRAFHEGEKRIKGMTERSSYKR